MLKYFILFLLIGTTFADDKDAKIVVTCPMIAICKPSDGAKQNREFAQINQEAYDCYRYIGETDLAESAAIATTKCMAIYGSNSANIITSDSEPK